MQQPPLVAFADKTTGQDNDSFNERTVKAECPRNGPPNRSRHELEAGRRTNRLHSTQAFLPVLAQSALSGISTTETSLSF